MCASPILSSLVALFSLRPSPVSSLLLFLLSRLQQVVDADGRKSDECLSICVCVTLSSVSVYVVPASACVGVPDAMRAIRMAAELVKKGGDKKAEEEGSCETREKAKEALRRQPVHYHSHGGAPYPSVYRISSTILFMRGPLSTHPSGPICELRPCFCGGAPYTRPCVGPLEVGPSMEPGESRPCGAGGEAGRSVDEGAAFVRRWAA